MIPVRVLLGILIALAGLSWSGEALAQCWATGVGFIVDVDGIDSFSGIGTGMKDGSVGGNWQHNDEGTGRLFQGQIAYLVCRHVDEPGPGAPSGANGSFVMNQAYLGGPAQVFDLGSGWADGFWLDVLLEDHGEPGTQGSQGPDFYHITVRDQTSGGSGTVVYETSGDLAGGNIQIYPPNNGHPFVPSLLPPWVSFEP